MLLGVRPAALAAPVAVRHTQGEVHAFLLIRSDSGKVLGTGDEVNVRKGRSWQSHFTLRFHDGSLHEETATYTQGAALHLLSYHLLQKGPAFPQAADLSIDTARSEVTYHEANGGRDDVKTEHMDLPADLANGMLPMVLQNFPRGTDEIKVGYVATTPKPRLVTFTIRRDGQKSFAVGGMPARAVQYLIHVDIGGIAGLLAPLVGKAPPDVEAWVSSGDAPTFLKLDSFLYLGGPIWHVELTSPSWHTEH